MGNVLAFVETVGNKLRSSALANISLARKAAGHHGGDVVLAVIGAGTSEAAADAARYAKKVVVVDDPRLGNYLAETYAPILARLAGEHGATVICATATAIGKDVLPRVAALTSAGMASDVADMTGPQEFKR